MDDYGSDDESVQDYTETKVLLGYAETEPSSDLISHLGGEPVLPLRPSYWLSFFAEYVMSDMATSFLACRRTPR